MSNILSFEENGVPYDLHLNEGETNELGRHLRQRNELIHQETVLKRQRIMLEDRMRNLGYRFSDNQDVVDPTFRASAYDADEKLIKINNLVLILTKGAEVSRYGFVIMIKEDWITLQDKNGNKIRRKPANVKIIAPAPPASWGSSPQVGGNNAVLEDNEVIVVDDAIVREDDNRGAKRKSAVTEE